MVLTITITLNTKQHQQTFNSTSQTVLLSASSNVTFVPHGGATARANPLWILEQTWSSRNDATCNPGQ